MRRRTFIRTAVGLGAVSAVGAAGQAWGATGTAGAPATRLVARAAATGGSNYGWYRLDGCTREQYGVINTYHRAADTIASQLRTMYGNGQRRLRVLVYHHRGPDTGTVMDSTGGNLSPQNRSNLTELLAAIKRTGFEEIQVAFLPIGDNAAYTWSSWREDVYQENWNLVHNLRPIVAAAGIPYRFDLCNEAIPASNQPMLLAYTQRLWTDYTHVHGKDDTSGFSIIADPDRIRRIPEVYRGNLPYLFDFHFYPDAAGDEYQRFTAAHRLMNELGLGGAGWIIGEAHYNDVTAAANLQRAIADTGRTVFYLLQWPWSRQKRCADVDVAPPLDFANYRAHAF